jgi:hypothetical protein
LPCRAAFDEGHEPCVIDRRSPDPARQRRALQIHARSTVDLGLPVERAVIGVFGHQHMGDRRLGGQGAFDQAARRRRLNHPRRTCPACIFRADRCNHPELGGDDIQSLGAIFTDPRHVAATAGTLRARRFDHLFDARQLLRQPAEIAPRLLSRSWSGRSGGARLRQS